MRGDKVYLSVRQLLSDALGSQRNKIPGFAQDTKLLFSHTQKTLREEGVSIQHYLSGASVRPVCEAKIRALAIDSTFGMKVETVTFQATVHPKSAPAAATAGDETQCCMPFGSSKQNDYMTQPNVAHFTVQKLHGGRERTVAQSVLTKDIDLCTSYPDFLSDDRQNFLAHVAPDRRATRVIAADNVEINHNGRNPKDIAALIGVYRSFFKANTTQYGSQADVATSFLVVGKDFSDALTELPDVPNTYAPQNLLEWSDKTNRTVGKLDLDTDAHAITVRLTPIETAQPTGSAPPLRHSIRYLTYQDLPEVTHVVAQSHPAAVNPERVQKLQNLLQGKDIANAVRERPNLSIGVGNANRLSGYLIAFEGTIPDRTERPIVIAETGTVPKGAYAAGALLKTFTDLYRENYATKGHLPPVIIPAAGLPSEAFVKRAAERMAKSLGVIQQIAQVTLCGEPVIRVTFSPPGEMPSNKTPARPRSTHTGR
jgi:hypothetical protein